MVEQSVREVVNKIIADKLGIPVRSIAPEMVIPREHIRTITRMVAAKLGRGVIVKPGPVTVRSVFAGIS